MGYKYDELRPRLFTEEGQDMLIKFLNRSKELLTQSGAVRMQELMRTMSGDSWMMLACVDRLVEMNLLREVTGSGEAGQHRVFVARGG